MIKLTREQKIKRYKKQGIDVFEIKEDWLKGMTNPYFRQKYGFSREWIRILLGLAGTTEQDKLIHLKNRRKNMNRKAKKKLLIKMLEEENLQLPGK